MLQAKLFGVGVLVVPEDFKVQLSGFDQFGVVVCCLWRDGDKRGRQVFELRDRGVQSIKLNVAIRSPHASKERHDQRTFRQQIG